MGRLGLERLEDRRLLAFSGTLATKLLRDINTLDDGSNPRQFMASGGNVFFVAEDGRSGLELFVTDGSSKGRLVKDIAPGSDGSRPMHLFDHNGILYFTAETEEHGREIWRSDGTGSGTFLLADINPGEDSSDAWQFTAAADKFFFVANDGSTGSELWVSDGSPSETFRASDIVAGNEGSAPRELLFAPSIDDGTLFFSALSDADGRELWRASLEGTTSRVVDLLPNRNPNEAPWFFEYFAEDEFVGETPVIRDTNNVPIVGEKNSAGEWVFERSDGTLVDPSIHYPLSSDPRGMTLLDGKVYFSAAGYKEVSDGVTVRYEPTGRELWVTDGTEDGTELVADVADLFIRWPAVVQRTPRIEIEVDRVASSDPRDLTVLASALYFTADTFGEENDSDIGRELWKVSYTLDSDGRRQHEFELVRDINPGPQDAEIGQLTALDSQLIFVATNSQGKELWRSDGTSLGTRIAKDIIPGSGWSRIEQVTKFGNSVVFSVDDEQVGRELYISNGTPGGTHLVKDIRPGNQHSDSNPSDMFTSSGQVYFAANDGRQGGEVWKTDGTEAGTVLVDVESAVTLGSDPTQLTAIGADQVFFSATSPEAGEEVWASDGTSGGTRLIKDLNPGEGLLFPLGSNPRQFIDLKGKAVFVADSRLWVSDGTEAGTQPISEAVHPAQLTVHGDELYFTGETEFAGRELWVTDGSADGTHMVLDIDPAFTTVSNGQFAPPTVIANSSNPTDIVSVGGSLYFSAKDPDVGVELFISDGTEAGTSVLADIEVPITTPGTVDLRDPGGLSGDPHSFVPFDDGEGNVGMYFLADDGRSGDELWKTDGTTAGTTMVADLGAGGEGAFIFDMQVVGSTLFFRRDDTWAEDGPYGNELWKSDGTAAGTGIVKDIFPGIDGSDCVSETSGDTMVEFGGALVFVAANEATDSSPGCELFVSDGTPDGTDLLLDVFPEELESSYPEHLTVVGDSLYFQASIESGRQVFRLTTEGDIRRTDFVDADIPSQPFAVLNESVYFSANDGNTGNELWSTDGSIDYGDEIYEVLAKDIAYRDWAPSDSFNLASIGYDIPVGFRVDAFWNDPVSNFQAVGLINEDVGPVLAVRGSLEIPDWLGNADPRGVGVVQYLANRDSVESWLSGVTTSTHQPSIVGHSLGGALTQLIASGYTEGGGQLDTVFTFNAPGVSSDFAEPFDPTKVERVTHFVTNGDLVSMAGDEFITGSWVRSSFGGINLAHKHTFPVLSSKIQTYGDDGEPDGVRNRPELEIETFETVDRLNSPFYFHTDAGYLGWLAAAQVAALSNDLIPNHLPGALLFRTTTEGTRRQIGNALQPLLDVVSVAACGDDDVALTLPDFRHTFSGLITIEATGLSASCKSATVPPADPQPESFWLQGQVRLPDFLNATADFTGDNRVQISAAGVDWVGQLSVEDIPIAPNFLNINSASLSIDTIANRVVAAGELEVVPWGLTVDGSIGLWDGQLDSLSGGVSGLNVPVGPVFVQSVGGGVANIAHPDPLLFSADNIGLTLGPRKTLNLPAWAGGRIEAQLLAATVGGEVDSQHVSGNGQAALLSNLATADGNVEWNWEEGFLTASGEFQVLNGIIQSTAASFTANSELNLNAFAAAEFTVPAAIPVFGGTTVGSGSFFLIYNHDSDNSNDSVGAFTTVALPVIGDVNVGFRVWLDGSFAAIGAADVEEVTPAPPEAEGGGVNVQQPSAQFAIDAGREWALFSAEWENDANPVVSLTTPTGETLRASDIEARSDAAVVSDLSNSRRRVIAIANPAAGNWTVSAEDAAGAGEVSFHSLVQDTAPTVAISGAAATTLGGPVGITYSTNGADSQAQVSLYYDTDQEGFNGVLISSGMPADSAIPVDWDTTNVPAGEYYVYAMVDDGVNAPRFTYFPDTIQVVTSGFQGTTFADLNADGNWNDEEAALGHVAVYLDLNEDGEFDVGEPSVVSGADGTYALSHLAPGTYHLRTLPLVGYVPSLTANSLTEIEVRQDVIIDDVNLGARQTPAAVSGIAWEDLNLDGFRDENEPTLRRVGIRAIDENGVEFSSTQSSSIGEYRLDGLIPGNYVLHFELPRLFAVTSLNHRGSDTHDSDIDPQTMQKSVALASGESHSSLGIGFFNTWHNYRQSQDVNGDGSVGATDVLSIINYLNSGQPNAPTDTTLSPPTYRDVNGDSFVSSNDVLLVINFLNEASAGEAEGASVAAWSPLFTIPDVADSLASEEIRQSPDPTLETARRDAAFAAWPARVVTARDQPRSADVLLERRWSTELVKLLEGEILSDDLLAKANRGT